MSSTPKIDEVDVVIYHANCSDGFGAAWAVYKRFRGKKDIQYLPGSHVDKEEEADKWIAAVKGKRVVCFDFSFSRDLTIKLHAASTSFQVIDHHATAEAELIDLPYCYFDMSKSGAMLAWEAIHHEHATDYWIFTEPQEHPPPKLIEYVQDRDLWQWKLPNSKAIWNFINSVPRTFDNWDELSTTLSNKKTREVATKVGEAMLAKVAHLSGVIAGDYEMWDIAGHKVPVSNCPSILRSDVCESLGVEGSFPFVGCYQIEDGQATWSLRSNHGTENVSLIAQTYPGGGGHAQAAGFTIPIDRMDFVNKTIK